MSKIKIKETHCADTRHVEEGKFPTKAELLRDSKLHIEAVSKTMSLMARLIVIAGQNHDWTKIEYIDEFHNNFLSVLKDNSIEFKDLGWWSTHLQERHHLNDRCPDDVNLIDVMEMVCDCVCAGLARSGEVRDVTIPYEILDKAVRNTAKLLEETIEVVK